MNYPLCRHIHPKGVRCGSPSLKQRDFCFYHQHLYDRHTKLLQTPLSEGQTVSSDQIELIPLDGPDSIQLALSLVINALAAGQIETRRASAILYGLQLASRNAAHLKTPSLNEIVTEAVPSANGPGIARPATVEIRSSEEAWADFLKRRTQASEASK